MVWNSLIVASLPSLFELWQTQEENLFVKAGMTLGLFMVSYIVRYVTFSVNFAKESAILCVIFLDVPMLGQLHGSAASRVLLGAKETGLQEV